MDKITQSYDFMVKHLLFFSTYHPAPVSSFIDTKIKETIEKFGDARNIELWNWTPEQKGLLNEIIRRMIMTSHWSTGKTRIMFEKAKILAILGQIVIFVLYCSEISESESENFGKYAPALLSCSLQNEIDIGVQNNKWNHENFKLVITDNLRDVISKTGQITT